MISSQIPVSPIAVISLAEFLEEPEPDSSPSLLGNGVIARRSLNILAGEDGVGKTMFAVNLALSLAAGQPFLGFEVSGPVRVLFLEAEGNRYMFRDRVRTASKSLALPGDLPIFFSSREVDLAMNGPHFAAMLAGSAAELVVMDTDSYFYDGDENSNTEWKRFVSKPLRGVTRDRDLSFLVIQHFGKPSETRGGRNQIRGASAQSGDADTTMTLEAHRDDSTRRVLTFEKIKNGPSQ